MNHYRIFFIILALTLLLPLPMVLAPKEDKCKDKKEDCTPNSGGGFFADGLNQQEYSALLDIRDTLKQILIEEKKQTELQWCILSGYSDINWDYLKPTYTPQQFCHEKYVESIKV